MSSFGYGDTDPYADGPQAYVPSTPSASAAPPSSNITVAPGFTPDYSGLLASDPTIASANNTAQANQQGADAARRASVRSQYVQYGGDLPAGWTDKYGDIDQATKDAASGNQFSTIANLRTNYDKSVDSFKKALAARGALQSSELTYGQDQLDRGLAQQRYDAGNSFLGNVSGDYGTYAGVLGQNARDLASAVSTATGNVYGDPANRPVAPSVAHYDTSNSAKYGKPVYSDEWGTLYDQFGNVLVAGTPPPPAPTPPPATSPAAPTGGTSPPPSPAPPSTSTTPASGSFNTVNLGSLGSFPENYGAFARRVESLPPAAVQSDIARAFAAPAKAVAATFSAPVYAPRVPNYQARRNAY